MTGAESGTTRTWYDHGWRKSVLPTEPLGEEDRTAIGLPRTLRPLAGEDLTQGTVFDPALKQYTSAYRAADPSFDDPARTGAWRAARRQAMDLVLAAIAGSPWAASLVLRGSVLMAAWFGEAAREPGDLDFVVVPADWGIEDDRTAALFDGIPQVVQGAAEECGSGLRLAAEDAVSDDIWTYDRVPGRRLVLPWSAPGLPGGQVQIDFVFNEQLPRAVTTTRVPALGGDGEGALLRTVTPELSLAWKVMWLINDSYPQGKDLYDAVLLAERYPLPYARLAEVFRLSGEWPHADRQDVRLEDFDEINEYVEWEDFLTEYPHVDATGQEYVGRLVEALTPTFARP
ncbi:nucleotidyl transferase AbiEii/AbiGii toxin family protein [Streptomyces odontomachi]|uniref:nucleotidyl transferase AbiEii/AbiGii toxin family protein n=1 Tax=Streptomyces odontomachi TaxID=2944940 RepID=UPI00210EADB6|nr:nucleotidyl transferase AbiEii/AbiGii toxin family protein [Streptomyces sp. ODS25]